MNEQKQPYTVLDDDGIYHYPVKTDGSVYLAPIRLCDPFQIVGLGVDGDGLQYYIVEHDNNRCIIARGDVGTSEGWRQLRNNINIPSKRLKLDLLTEYIQEHTDIPEWQVTEVAGWHGDAYILPNGEIIGKSDNLYFNGKISYNKKVGYKSKGGLTKWKHHIGRYAAGNSRLCLMLGSAFAAPLLRLLNIDGGILHLYGQSSSGKTSAQRVAQSVWGHSDTGEGWNTTAFALINNAAARNDGLLSMDEMGEDMYGKSVENSIYSLANGKGRSLGAKDGGNRAEIRFRVLGISTGETSLESHLSKNDRMTMAGQLVRCPSIHHQLETFHDFTDFRDFTEHLNNAVTRYYACAGRAFVKKVMNEDNFAEILKAKYQTHLDFLKAKTESSQLSRSAKLFAATMTAIELACQWDITGFDAKTAIDGINQCFNDWLKDQPRGSSYEVNKIILNMGDYMQTKEPFFQNPEEPTYVINDFPGFVKHKPAGFGETEDTYHYYLFPKVFRDKIIQGFDENKAKEILHEIGWLLKSEDNRWLKQLYGRGENNKRKRLGYFLVFDGIEPPAGNHED